MAQMVINYVNYANSGDDWDSDPVSPPPPPVQRTQSQSLPASSFVSIAVDGGFLPSRLEFVENWEYKVSPNEVGRELLNAYRYAVAERLKALAGSAGGQLNSEYRHDHFLSSRENLILLLETDSWDQYTQTREKVFGFGEYRVHGDAHLHGEPVMTVTGDKNAIRGFTVWSSWHGCADPSALENEVLACADRIRASLPKFKPRRDWSRYSDGQLRELRNLHQRDLLENRGYWS